MQMSMGEQMSQEQPAAEQGQAGQGQAGGTPPENPILDAVRTIGTYIAALSEQGDPAATELQNIMSQFVQALGKKAGAESGMAPPPPEGGKQPAGASQAQAPGGGRGVNPMLGNMSSSGTKAQRGQVAVI